VLFTELFLHRTITKILTIQRDTITAFQFTRLLQATKPPPQNTGELTGAEFRIKKTRVAFRTFHSPGYNLGADSGWILIHGVDSFE
jgi:hypothetical protein